MKNMMFLIVLLVNLPGISQADSSKGAAEAFAKMKGLAGSWRDISDPIDAKPAVKFSVHSNGSSLMEEYEGMLSVYHLDGNSILMTHYCSAGNQPRVRAITFDETLGELRFNFVDITFSRPGKHYINGLNLKWINENRIEEIWYSQGSQEYKMVLERVPDLGGAK